MNVRVGDIIKLENNQFVAVSAALKQVWFQLGGWHTWNGVVPLPLCFCTPSSLPRVGTLGTSQPRSCI